MARASAAPATKNDIANLRKEMKGAYATKGDFMSFGKELRKEMKDLHNDTIRQFKFIAEQIHKDAIDANKERIELHEDRITRLERYVGVPRSLSA